ncbi:hypothetical protein J6590_019351 [Homalodisca vitripennis]|nr:hypothetical protein J6590_019351 [Homalodisca vitripennis]
MFPTNIHTSVIFSENLLLVGIPWTLVLQQPHWLCNLILYLVFVLLLICRDENSSHEVKFHVNLFLKLLMQYIASGLIDLGCSTRTDTPTFSALSGVRTDLDLPGSFDFKADEQVLKLFILLLIVFLHGAVP